MKISPCPFCKSSKVKLMCNSVSASGQWPDGKSTLGDRYRYSVRCNSCKARGPIVSCWVPLMLRAPRGDAVDKTLVEQYEREKQQAEEKAVALWNAAYQP